MHGYVPAGLFLLAAIVVSALLVRRPWRRWSRVWGTAAAIGCGVGLASGLLLGMLAHLYDDVAALGALAWFGGTGAAIAVAVAGLLVPDKGRGRRWRIALAAAAIPIVAVTGAVGTNIAVGEFANLSAVVALGEFEPIALPSATPEPASAGSLASSWRPPSGLRGTGRIGTVVIPPEVSGFRSRDALVYLPPAALVARPPRLPVLVLMSGQPGSPQQFAVSAQLQRHLDAFARRHRGLAPIVVVADQLGHAESNPMCVDSRLGASATYLTVDVPHWIRRHLNVLSARRDWAIGGFSQGGTCAIQLGAGHPELFGSLLDISGEVAPSRGSDADTVESGFGGSVSAYAAATPSAVLSRYAPYPDSVAVFGLGDGDGRFGPGVRMIAARAGAAGMHTHLFVSSGSAHDWRTVDFALENALDVFAAHWGLD
ncbi:alpha/beta hydrolase [Lacisediminihabitans sp.]|uniref:alpha/beta hydrolase n=1 Tax=Lacisediminihabitans sp. TaxID=2787631 RepID=UPI00374DC897